MINVEFCGKLFKIYASGKITSPNATNDEITFLKNTVYWIKMDYNNPSDGFLVSFIASKLPKYGVKIISYIDYELKNAPEDRIY